MSTSPKWFRPVAVVALLWNLLGCAAYLVDVSLSPEQIAKLTPEQQALYASRPAWAVAATAIAVWFGAAGSLGLVLKKAWATWLLVLSLAGVVAQDLWLFVLSDAAAEVAAKLLVAHADDLDALVLGGDRFALASALEDPRLRRFAAITSERVLDVPDPKLAVLRSTPDRFRATILNPRPASHEAESR